MRIKNIPALGFALIALIIAGAIGISCSNPDQRPLDTIFAPFPTPLAKSPVGLIISDPVFRQREPDPLIAERYKAAALTAMTTSDLWNYFTGAASRIDLVGTRVTNSDMVNRLVSIANKGVQINIVCEEGYFNDSEAAPFISQLSQSGNITIKTDDDGIARQVHAAYAIIDDHIVLASSGDFLDDAFNTSINNILVINTPRTYVDGTGPGAVTTVTDAFLFDFDQMFNQGRFGGDKDILINHSFNIGVTVEIYFGPNDNLLGEIIDEVNNMNTSLSFMINQVTDSNILSILANLAFGGYYDGWLNPDYTDLLPNALPYSWPGYNTLNHKIMIIDVPVNITETQEPLLVSLLDPVIISGSNNWNQSGLTLNDEQMLVCHDLTLGYEIGFIEYEVINRSTLGLGMVFGKMRTSHNVPIEGVDLTCDSELIPGGVFTGDGGVPSEATSTAQGVYFMMWDDFLGVPTGFLRNIQVLDLGDAADSYLLPLTIWGEDQPNEGWYLLPGASYRADFYATPRPTQTGTGTGGGGGGGGFGG